MLDKTGEFETTVYIKIVQIKQAHWALLIGRDHQVHPVRGTQDVRGMGMQTSQVTQESRYRRTYNSGHDQGHCVPRRVPQRRHGR